MPTPLQTLLGSLKALSPADRQAVRAVLEALESPDHTEQRLLDLLADHGQLLRSGRGPGAHRRPVARFLATDVAAAGDASLIVSEPALQRAAPGLTDRLEAVVLSPVVSTLAEGLAARHRLAPSLAVDLASALLLRACYQVAGLVGPRFVISSEDAARAAALEGLAIEPRT